MWYEYTEAFAAIPTRLAGHTLVSMWMVYVATGALSLRQITANYFKIGDWFPNFEWIFSDLQE